MSTLTATAKGQVTLRKDLLKHLAFILARKSCGQASRRSNWNECSPTDWKNFGRVRSLDEKGQPFLSVEEINEVARGWAGRPWRS